MDEIQIAKNQIRRDIAKNLAALSNKDIAEKTKAIEKKLFEFANFLEARIALLYVNCDNEVATGDILAKSYVFNKVVVLPTFNIETFEMTIMKVEDPEKDLVVGPRGILEPDAIRCKIVPIDQVDIAIIPAIALDEKGGRIGSGEGYYDRLIPNLAITTRKVALALEEQIVQQVPIESHDKHVDIIITDKRIIYKI